MTIDYDVELKAIWNMDPTHLEIECKRCKHKFDDESYTRHSKICIDREEYGVNRWFDL